MADEGLSMLVNYGSQDVSFPTEEDFMVESEQFFSGGRVAYLSSDKVIPGSWLKIYLKVAKGMRIVFSVSTHNGKQQNI